MVQLMAALALPAVGSTQHDGLLPTFRLTVAGPCIPAANYWGAERVAPLCAWHHSDERACDAAVDSEGFGACEYTGGEDWMHSFSHWNVEDWSSYHERLVAAHGARARAFLANVVVEWTDANAVEELDPRLLSHMESWLLVLSDDSEEAKLSCWPSCRGDFDAHEVSDGGAESTRMADCVTERSRKADEMPVSAPTLELLRELSDHSEWSAFRTSVKRRRVDEPGEASSDAAYTLIELVRVWDEWRRWQRYCRA